MDKPICKPFSIVLLFILSALLIGILAGCGEENADTTTVATTKEITIATSSTPLTTPSAPTTTTAASMTTTALITTDPQTTEAPATTAPIDCVHDRPLSICPYCNCEKHSWNYSDSTATCTENGTRIRSCTKCGYSDIIEIEAYGHNYHFGKCSHCNDTLPPLEITIPIPDPGKLEAEIIAASAKQYDEDPQDFSVEFVADLGSGAYAIFVDGPWDYPCMVTEQIVHGYLFWYSSGRTMWIYKDGVVYGLSKAYEQSVIDAKQVLNLYLIYADQKGYLSARNPEKTYSDATLEYHFIDNQISIWVFSEYNSYQYTANDFSEINCIELYESPWQNYEDGKRFRRILLTLDKKSKHNVLNCIQILQLRVEIYAADVNSLEFTE